MFISQKEERKTRQPNEYIMAVENSSFTKGGESAFEDESDQDSKMVK